MAARYGGEEFACVLPETENEGAMAVANRILEGVRSLGIPHARSKVADHVTISVGVASAVPPLKGRAVDILSTADRALYKAKQKGRNQIVNSDISKE